MWIKKIRICMAMPKLIKEVFLSALENKFSIQISKLRATMKNEIEYFVRIARNSSGPGCSKLG